MKKYLHLGSDIKMLYDINEINNIRNMLQLNDEILKSVTKITGEVKRSHLIQLNDRNEVFLIFGAKRKIVLKSSKNLKLIENEYNILNYLSSTYNKLPIPKVFSLNAMENKYFILQEVLKGKSLKTIIFNKKRKDYPIIIKEIALLMKELHEINIKNCNKNSMEDLFEVAQNNLKNNLLDLNEFENILPPNELLEWLINNQPSETSECLIHGDFRPKNILWDGKKITGLLDWEHSFYLSFYYDIVLLCLKKYPALKA